MGEDQSTFLETCLEISLAISKESTVDLPNKLVRVGSHNIWRARRDFRRESCKQLGAMILTCRLFAGFCRSLSLM
jgi:hypothetical protein